MFEELLEKLGNRMDEEIDKFKKKNAEIKQKIKKQIKKSKDGLTKSEELFKRDINKRLSKKSISGKNLTRFEETIGNISVNLAHNLEKGVKKLTNKIICEPDELTTKYGILGNISGNKFILKSEAHRCLQYLQVLQKKLPHNLKLKKALLTDCVGTISKSNSELFGYYVYGYLWHQKLPINAEKKKAIIKKYLFSKEEKDFYEKEG